MTPEQINELADWLEEIAEIHLSGYKQPKEIAAVLRACAKPEPIYQLWDNDRWNDCTEDFYFTYDAPKKRIVYTTPQPDNRDECAECVPAEWLARRDELIETLKGEVGLMASKAYHSELNHVIAAELDAANARIKELEAQQDELLIALNRLACLGNGDRYGNSVGNIIAQEAIAKIEAEKNKNG